MVTKIVIKDEGNVLGELQKLYFKIFKEMPSKEELLELALYSYFSLLNNIKENLDEINTKCDA